MIQDSEFNWWLTRGASNGVENRSYNPICENDPLREINAQWWVMCN